MAHFGPDQNIVSALLTKADSCYLQSNLGLGAVNIRKNMTFRNKSQMKNFKNCHDEN